MTDAVATAHLDSVGVLCHLMRPTLAECAALAAAAESAGAGWCLFPDALGWRDVWLSLAAAAQSTSTILLGPGLTNPYTRHPFVTVSALASFHELSAGRSVFGVAAGGSELSLYADIDRSDAPERVRALIGLLRRAQEGETPLPFAASIPAAPVIGGARSKRMLATVGECCDVALIWGQTHVMLEDSARAVATGGAAVAWAPLRTSDEQHARAALVYGILNSPVGVRRALEVDADLEVQIRLRLEQKGFDEAAGLVPDSALSAFMVGDSIAASQAIINRLNARHVVVLCFDVEDLADRVAWAREVASAIPGEGKEGR
jgi:5,10-methylenetetrahydromethanopterin reductase